MIKIFGKIRYHWQPDLTTSVTYWSATFTIFFISMIFTLENTEVYWLTFVIFFVFLFFVAIGFHRYFYFENDELFVVSLFKKERARVKISDIRAIQIAPHGVRIYCEKWKDGRIFYMRRWHKEPFMEAIREMQEFKAEITEIEHF
ncbi:hypothetical protein SAMN02745116_00142 [Pilibacter termitis]|uniref:Uncharacterized protein n=1 Tax=Pilibacter termitis TaxID=263852 RepID=A0A1T4K863_9ENTE|nr:EbsA family protein [Pilibacter termitis]SJZ38505.1 hypothetical protein SAMN02745116_00142 [Pilibacter termitis]